MKSEMSSANNNYLFLRLRTQWHVYKSIQKCSLLPIFVTAPCPSIDSIMILMIVWRITGKIIRTTIMLLHMHTYNGVILQFWVQVIFVFCVFLKRLNFLFQFHCKG